MVSARPLLGVGPGNWPIEFPRYAEPGAARDGVLSVTLAPRQAHEDVLERAAETGALGLAALGFFAFGTIVAIRARLRLADDDVRASTAAAAGALVAVVVISLASFPLDAPGTLAMTGLALGLVVADPAREPRAARSRTFAYALCGGAIVLLLGASLRAAHHVRGSRELALAERTFHAGPGAENLRLGLEALARSLRAVPNSFRAELSLAHALLRAGDPPHAVDAARRALALEPYSPNAWAALADAELAGGDPQGARRDASQALTLLEDFPYPLLVRANAEEEEGDTGAAEADRTEAQALAARAEERARAARELLRRSN